MTKKKALELFRSLLDMSVLELMIEGVPLVGEETPSPLFSKRHRPGSLDPVQLSAQSELRRQSLYLTKGLMVCKRNRALRWLRVTFWVLARVREKCQRIWARVTGRSLRGLFCAKARSRKLG